MYEEFFGLNERPFNILSNPDYLFLSLAHKQALVHLEYGILQRVSFIVITGEIGTGKTTLIKKLLKNIKPEISIASIFTTIVNTEEFIELILQEFGLVFENKSKIEKLVELKQLLINKYESNNPVVLIVDEAQNLSLEVLEEIRLISNLQTEKGFLLQTILVGQPELKRKLENPKIMQLAQRISVYYHLLPLDLKETTEYINYRLKISGYTSDNPLFIESAVIVIYEYSKGIPRVINMICDQAMVYAYGNEVRQIDENIIKEIISDNQVVFFTNRSVENKSSGELTKSNGITNEIAAIDNRYFEQIENRMNFLEDAFMSISKIVNKYLSDQSIKSPVNMFTKEEVLNLLNKDVGYMDAFMSLANAVNAVNKYLSEQPIKSPDTFTKEEVFNSMNKNVGYLMEEIIQLKKKIGIGHEELHKKTNNKRSFWKRLINFL